MSAIAENNEFNSDVALSLLESGEEFPVDFDRAVVWWDCKTRDGKSVRRDNLVRKLKENFDQGIDYHLLKNEEVVKRPQGGGSGIDKVFLTVDCFKSFGMMVSGERGKQIRRYFIECERQLKYVSTRIESRLASIEAKLENVKPSHADPERPQLQSAEDRSAAQKTREQQELYWLTVKGSYTNASVESLMRKFRW